MKILIRFLSLLMALQAFQIKPMDRAIHHVKNALTISENISQNVKALRNPNIQQENITEASRELKESRETFLQLYNNAKRILTIGAGLAIAIGAFYLMKNAKPKLGIASLFALNTVNNYGMEHLENTVSDDFIGHESYIANIEPEIEQFNSVDNLDSLDNPEMNCLQAMATENSVDLDSFDPVGAIDLVAETEQFANPANSIDLSVYHEMEHVKPFESLETFAVHDDAYNPAQTTKVCPEFDISDSNFRPTIKNWTVIV